VSEEYKPPNHVMNEWRKACGCCPECSPYPCDGVMAGGMCDHLDCECDNHEEEAVMNCTKCGAFMDTEICPNLGCDSNKSASLDSYIAKQLSLERAKEIFNQFASDVYATGGSTVNDIRTVATKSMDETGFIVALTVNGFIENDKHIKSRTEG